MITEDEFPEIAQPVLTVTQTTLVVEDNVAEGPSEGITAQQTTQPKREYAQYMWSAKTPNARLVYIRDLEQAEAELARFKPGLVGFDMEWKPCFYKGQQENPVALIQVSNEDTILLIQISAMSSTRISFRTAVTGLIP